MKTWKAIIFVTALSLGLAGRLVAQAPTEPTHPQSWTGYEGTGVVPPQSWVWSFPAADYVYFSLGVSAQMNNTDDPPTVSQFQVTYTQFGGNQQVGNIPAVGGNFGSSANPVRLAVGSQLTIAFTVTPPADGPDVGTDQGTVSVVLNPFSWNTAGTMGGWSSSNETYNYTATDIPEPATLALLGIGTVSLLGYAGRRTTRA